MGTKTSLAGVDFAETLYLEITVDADGSDTITAADSPLLPRQILLPAVFASEAGDTREVQGIEVFANGKLKSSLIETNTIPAAAIVADDSIVAGQLAPDSVRAEEIEVGAVGTSEVKDGSILEEDLEEELLRKLNPPGTVMGFAGAIPPEGWLMCDGRVVAQIDYPYLWSAIGTSHGAGTPSDGDFNLPDYRGRFLRGTDDPDGPEGAVYSAAGNDPDVNARGSMSPGGNSGNRVGSVRGDQFRSHVHGGTWRWNAGSEGGYSGSGNLRQGQTG